MIAPRVNGMVDDQGFVCAEVTIGQPVHQPVADGIQSRRCARLRDAGARTRTQRRPRGGVQNGVGLPVIAKRRVAGIGPIDVKLPDTYGVVRPNPCAVVYFHEVVRRTRGRECRTVEVGGQHPAKPGIDVVQIEELERRRGVANEHFAALENEDTGPTPRTAIRELVDRHVVAVRPDAELGVVVHLSGANLKCIAVPRAGRIGGLGDGDALVIWPIHGELAHQPAIRQGIKERDWIAVVGVLTRAAKALPERVAVDRAINLGGRAGDIPHGEGEVNPLDVVFRPGRRIVTDVALGVGRMHAVDVAQTVEAGQRVGHSRGSGYALHNRVCFHHNVRLKDFGQA